MAVVGQVAAGSPVEYLPFLEWRDVRLPSWATEHDQFVAVRVCGESLTGIGVNDGDYAVVHLTGDVREGDLCAVLSPSGMMIKFIKRQTDNTICLESANPEYPPRFFDVEDVMIQGRVVRTEHDW